MKHNFIFDVLILQIITKATADGTLYSRDWDTEPLFPLPDTSTLNIECVSLLSLGFTSCNFDIVKFMCQFFFTAVSTGLLFVVCPCSAWLVCSLHCFVKFKSSFRLAWD